ncbi:MAG TPA: diaminopropionate ammonia-lyase [Gemmatimonadales bacterium]|nr:diaminopropionate ammonia-lyase [Gemmatimonadales bacterium]
MPLSLINPQYRRDYRTSVPDSAPRQFHGTLPGYRPTALRPLPALAQRLGIGAIHLKDESDRFGLPAYKVLGAAWAACRLLRARYGLPDGTIETLGARAREDGIALLTATEGNHGRGVARVAQWLGLPADIYLPAGTARSRIEAIAGEGASVIEVPGSYDDAVAAAARRADGKHLLLQDQAWPGYEEIPAWIADGYDTILAEAEQQLSAAGEPPPDVVLVQIGVGTLASAVIRHFRATGRTHYPVLVGVEPDGAACGLRSVAAGAPVSFEAGAHSSIMAGLNCGTPSTAAFPLLRDGIQGFIAIDDFRVREAMRALAVEGVRAGASGAAGIGGLIELMQLEEERRALGIGASTRILAISTEGPTEPLLWAETTGMAP